MTYTQRQAIANPVQGLIIYCTDCGINGGEPQYYNGYDWLNMTGGEAKVGSASKWQSKNLNVTTYKNGDTIPEVADSAQWVNLTTGAWCWYNNDSATNSSTFGRLYNWYAVNDPRGLAPQGWHIPTNTEWNKLTKMIDPLADTNLCCSNRAGIAMKNSNGWNSNDWSDISGNGTNSSGFSGLPGGARLDGKFMLFDLFGFWWTSSEYDLANSRCKSLSYNFSYIYLDPVATKTSGLSIRIVSDK